jgi:bleomycin hydrolase
MRFEMTLMLSLAIGFQAAAQENPVSIQATDNNGFSILKNNAATAVKDQGNTGTCWCFATISLIESECLRTGVEKPDISEMYAVRNTYLYKARNYVLRQGDSRFGQGGLGHDVLNAAGRYGLMPEAAFSGLKEGQKRFDHNEMEKALKTYLDSILKKRPVSRDWETGYTAIMDGYMGQTPPATFDYNGKTYTPEKYAKEVVKFNPDDYISLTSFTHHPFYSSFVLEIPDNHANGSFYNVTLEELIGATKAAVQKGYTVMWDADVSNKGFISKYGYAFSPEHDTVPNRTHPDPDLSEVKVTSEYRQGLFENLITQDDHLMHITGIGKSKKGNLSLL